MKKRVNIVMVFMTIVFCALAARLVFLSLFAEMEKSQPVIIEDGINDADTINDEFLLDAPVSAEAEKKANDIGFTFDGGFGVKTQ
jgi:hypothetical protein